MSVPQGSVIGPFTRRPSEESLPLGTEYGSQEMSRQGRAEETSSGHGHENCGVEKDSK